MRASTRMRCAPAARSFYNEHGYHEGAVVRGMYSERLAGVKLEKWLGVPREE